MCTGEMWSTTNMNTKWIIEMNHKRNKVHEALSWKWGRAPISYGGASTHYFRGLEHPSFQRGREHSLFEEQLIENKWMHTNEYRNESWKKQSSWSALLKNEGTHPFLQGARAPIILEGSSTHYLRGREHSSFQGGVSTHYFRRLEHPLF